MENVHVACSTTWGWQSQGVNVDFIAGLPLPRVAH